MSAPRRSSCADRGAIRPPQPQAKLGSVASTGIRLANPRLAPERQQGWDAGIDAVFGNRGSLSVTVYDQTAENLIAMAYLAFTPILTSQSQNVGRVKNRGVEVEANASVGPLQLRGQYGYVHSRIEALGLTYSGDLVVGDEPLTVPRHTGGASIAATPYPGSTASVGMTYVGSYHSYDLIALYSCFGGTAPCRSGPGLRSYVVSYPSFVKLNATFSQRITPVISGFVSVDNLTDNRTHEFSFGAVMGRITTVGMQLHAR